MPILPFLLYGPHFSFCSFWYSIHISCLLLLSSLFSIHSISHGKRVVPAQGAIFFLPCHMVPLGWASFCLTWLIQGSSIQEIIQGRDTGKVQWKSSTLFAKWKEPLKREFGEWVILDVLWHVLSFWNRDLFRSTGLPLFGTVESDWLDYTGL